MPSVTLPDQVYLSYNGYVFPPETKTSVTVRPVWDETGRVVKYNAYTFNVEFLVSLHNVDLDDMTVPYSMFQELEMIDVRHRLTKAGGTLAYCSKGLGASWSGQGAFNIPGVGAADANGAFVVNGDTGVRDVAWGPKPEIIQWKPISGMSARCVWVCTTCIPDCDNSVFTNGISEHSYSISVSRNRAGYSRRIVSGHLIIPKTAAIDDRRVPPAESPELYLENVIPEVPNAFTRESLDYSISKDGIRLDYTVVDVELARPLPVGIVSCAASHSVSTSGPGLVKWVGTISARYVVSPDFHPKVAFNNFVDLVRDRMIEANKVEVAKGACIVPVGFSVSEPNFMDSNEVECSCSYTMSYPLPTLLPPGLWREVPNSNHADWRQSMSSGPHSVRGHRKLYNIRNDIMIDLCSDELPRPPSVRPARDYGFSNRHPFFIFTCPPPDSSWVAYSVRFEIQRRSGVIHHSPLPGGVTIIPRSAPAGREGEIIDTIIVDKNAPPILQQADQDKVEIVMYGEAARACYDIPEPILTKWGNSRLVRKDDPERGDGFWFGKVINVGVPVYSVRWQSRYVLVKPAEAVKLTTRQLNYDNKDTLPNGSAMSAQLDSDLLDALKGDLDPGFPKP